MVIQPTSMFSPPLSAEVFCHIVNPHFKTLRNPEFRRFPCYVVLWILCVCIDPVVLYASLSDCIFVGSDVQTVSTAFHPALRGSHFSRCVWLIRTVFPEQPLCNHLHLASPSLRQRAKDAHIAVFALCGFHSSTWLLRVFHSMLQQRWRSWPVEILRVPHNGSPGASHHPVCPRPRHLSYSTRTSKPRLVSRYFGQFC